MLKNKKGFSLVELIVVIAIMAVLVGVLAPQLMKYVEKSRIQKDESAAAEYVGAVEKALADNSEDGAYDEVMEALQTADTLTITYTATDYKINPNTCTFSPEGNFDKFTAEVVSVVPEFKQASKAHKGQNLEITISFGTGDTFKVEGNFVAAAGD